MHFQCLLWLECLAVRSKLLHVDPITVSTSIKLWWKSNVNRSPKSELVFKLISVGYFIAFVSIWNPFWTPDGACLLEDNLESENQLNLKSEEGKCLARVFLKYQLPKATIVQVANRVLIVCSLYKLTFVKMMPQIHLCTSCSWSA